jgi:anti-sigma factor RsiW
MDHEVASTTHAVERYLLGEMPSPERDDFEEHYFACPECAEGVRSASMMVRDIKQVLPDLGPAPKASSPGWLSWLKPQVMLPAFAALSLAVVVGYQNTVLMPDLKAPRSMGAAITLDGLTRGAAPALRAGDPLRFVTAVEASGGGHVYVELLRASGAVVRHGEVAAPPANTPLDVYFPGTLAPGKYQLVVRDSPGGKELARSSFDVVN